MAEHCGCGVWCDHQPVWCAIVECTASWLVARVVNRLGEPGLMRKREMFSLLAHFSWRVMVGPRELESALVP